MKTNKSLIKTQRRSLDEKLKAFGKAKDQPRPKAGWIKAIRESLGMSSYQLAVRMGIQQSGVILLEQREAHKKVSLEILEKAAHAMNCKLVYALVPEVSLENTVEEQSQKAAREILQQTLHTMGLEMQPVGEVEKELHLQEVATDLRNKLDRRLWSTKT